MTDRRRYVFRVVDDAGHECLRWTGAVDHPDDVAAVPDLGPRVRLVLAGEPVSVARGYRHPGRALTLTRQRMSGGPVVTRPVPPAWKGVPW